ncbi:MAG: FecR domain-containing protein [Variovorax sp.]
MKSLKIRAAMIGLSCLAGSALAQTPAAAPAVEPVAAHAGFVKMVRGDVQLLSAGGVLRPARAGDEVAPIERIVTGADSAASVVLRDGSTLVVGPSSRLDLKEFSFDATTRDGNMLVSLARGSLRMITGLIGKTQPDAVRVETQTATIGIRGTDFIVQADTTQ